MWIEPVGVLIYEDEVVGLRLLNQVLNTSWKEDIEIELVDKRTEIDYGSLKRIQLYKQGVKLVSKQELEGALGGRLRHRIRIGEVVAGSHTHTRLNSLLENNYSKSELEVIGQNVVKNILTLDSKSTRLRGKTVGVKQSYFVRGLVESPTRFNWSTNHEYTEYHYDSWGVLYDCPIMNKWEDSARERCLELAKQYGVNISFDLDGSKHKIHFSLNVSTLNKLKEVN